MDKALSLNELNLLKSTSVTIQTKDTILKVPMDTVPMFQLDWDNLSFSLYGMITLTDDIVTSSKIQFKDAVVTISFMDRFMQITNESFNVVKVIHSTYGANLKGYNLSLRDTASHALANSYLGKGYDKPKNIVAIMNEFLKELGQKELFKGELEVEQLVVPKHIPNYEFFTQEVYRRGASLYRKRDGFIYILKAEDSDFSKLDKEDLSLKEDTEKNYENRIHHKTISELSLIGKSQFSTTDFDFSSKENTSDDNNAIDNWSLNPLKEDAVQTTGFKPLFGNKRSHLEQLRRELQERNKVDVYLNGYCRRNVNTIVDVLLTGNKFDDRSVMMGDTANSGLYIVNKIQDRYVSGSLLQKLFLSRPDADKVIG